MKHILIVTLFCTVWVIGQTYVPIAQFKQRTIGQDSIRFGERIAGRVTVANQFRNTSYIQDATGGIAVFNSAFRNGVHVGDSVEFLAGMLTEFQPTSGQPGTGLSQISGASVAFQVIPVDRSEPRPLTVSIQTVGESVEGMLVRIRGVRFVESGVFQGDRNYNVRNMVGDQLQVRIDANTEIARNNLSIPTGTIDIVGVISQFRGTYQLLPRFASDLGLNIKPDTVPKEQTIDITTWNLYWFGSTDTTIGVVNKQRQFNSIRLALDSMMSDIYAFQEVVTKHALDSLAFSIQGSYSGYLAPIDQQQKMAYLTTNATTSVIETGLAVNGGAQAWAGGRFPYRMTVLCTIAGAQRRILIFNVHAKATGDSTTAQEDWQRRKTDAETFYDYLNTFYPNDPIVIIGDFNDDVTSSVVQPNPSPYRVFTNDTINWRVLTRPLSEQGLSSYIGSSVNARMIDHIIVSNELVHAIYRTYLEAPNAFLSSYTTTVSDHLPVTVRIIPERIISFAQMHEEPTIQIGPIPASEYLFIQFFTSMPEHIRITLYDGRGRQYATLLEEHGSQRILLVPVSCKNLSTGAYFLHIERNATYHIIPFFVVH